ncbi:RusA family crossover junction endodeoxyribonuclease [Parvularcula marina]|uniref:RusA family crossover junction endodeoxyribonuclease n=1 Tax=Parvularcula marina TaxID=2292771 RepID=A0A371RET2_9PROT|nr:RusA family crossover junction endodeoxyribonuclease [Parvularcula marina]RFB03961.1 RusA family crossover junction endodeoxyribonuclease [Parvularcula marina]
MGSGRGHVRLITQGDEVLILIDGATTQTRTLKKFVSAFMKENAASIRPWFGPFEVRIWTSVMADKRGHHDVDNVAKAVLDSLSGYIWRDDRQVVRLVSERFTGSANRIAVRVTPLEDQLPEVPLDNSLFSA